MFFPTHQSTVRQRISHLKRLLIGCILLAVVAPFMGGCGGKHVPPPEITFIIESESETNQGEPFYCAFRSVNANQFLTDGYDGVAALLFTNPPDESVLASLVLLPGEDQEIKIKRPEKVDIGLYCFFTQPGDPWKIKLDQPLGEEYEVALGENNIVEAEKDPGSWWWPF
ncbi:MAG: hypothetical protein PVF10_10760 [Syntrophobacterales bacterium]|jgi:hypothetical protein